MGGIGPFRIGLAGAAKNLHKNAIKRAPSTCLTGGFITSPSDGQQVDVGDDVMFAWDASCLNTTAADIYVHAPYQRTSLIQMFQNVDFTKGSYNATLKPKWWNSTDSVQLQLQIVQRGSPEFMATLPPGPVWIAKYNASSKNTDNSAIGTTSTGDANVTQVNNLQGAKSSGISKGGIAAAVLIPLIAIGLGLFAYIKISRKREESRRKRWSEAVDKRMSVISNDWRAMSVKGAEAAIRASMAGDPRASTWSGHGNAGVGVSRPSSAYLAEAAGDTHQQQPEMAQIRRPGVGPRAPIPSAAGSVGRVSRVSFAADTRFSRFSGDAMSATATSRGRPSVESRRAGIPSRAFHAAYIPPVPIPSRLSEYVPEVGEESAENSPIVMSPTQRSGPLDLSADDICARMNGEEGESRPSLDAVMPALSMMRTGNASDNGEAQPELLFERAYHPRGQGSGSGSVAALRVETNLPSSPSPVAGINMAGTAKSPIMESMPMSVPLSATGESMSPDAMLRAYAERRRAGGVVSPPGTPGPGGSPMSPIAFPMPVVNPGVGTGAGVGTTSPPSTMRTLYSPSSNSTTAHAHSFSGEETNPFRKSMMSSGNGGMVPQRPSTDMTHADENGAVSNGFGFGSAHQSNP